MAGAQNRFLSLKKSFIKTPTPQAAVTVMPSGGMIVGQKKMSDQ